MTPHLQSFLQRLIEEDISIRDWRFRESPSPHLELPALSEDVGPLVVWDAGPELILEFGNKFHWHFDSAEVQREWALHQQECVPSIFELAAQCAARILKEQIGVAIYYRDEQCLGASLLDLDIPNVDGSSAINHDDTMFIGATRVHRFKWSGPIL